MAKFVIKDAQSDEPSVEFFLSRDWKLYQTRSRR